MGSKICKAKRTQTSISVLSDGILKSWGMWFFYCPIHMWHSCIQYTWRLIMWVSMRRCWNEPETGFEEFGFLSCSLILIYRFHFVIQMYFHCMRVLLHKRLVITFDPSNIYNGWVIFRRSWSDIKRVIFDVFLKFFLKSF